MMAAFIRRKKSKPDAQGRRRLLGFEVQWIGPTGKPKRKTHKTQALAKAHCSVLNAPKPVEGTKPVGTQTVEDAGKDWVARVEANGRSEGTYSKYEEHLKNHVNPIMVAPSDGGEPMPFGAFKMVDVKTPVVLRFKAALQKAGRSQATVDKVMAHVRMLFNDAQLAGEVADNAARPVRAKRGDRHKPPVEIPTPDQVRLILAALRLTGDDPPTFAQAWVPLAPATGMRPNEQRALFWDNLLLDRVKPIARVAFGADEAGTIGPPKSKAGYRDLPLPPSLVPLLKRWKKACPASPAHAAHGGLVFPSAAGKVQDYSNILKRVWHPMMRSIGLMKPTGARDKKGNEILEPLFTPYALRHFYASYLIEVRGKNPKQVQRLMGHENIELTFQIYGHLFKDSQDDQAVAESLGEFLRPTAADIEKIDRLLLAKSA